MIESRFAQVWFDRYCCVALGIDHKRLNLMPSIAALKLLTGD